MEGGGCSFWYETLNEDSQENGISLSRAIKDDDDDEVKRIIDDCFVDLNSGSSSQAPTRTMLNRAAEDGSPKVVKWLLDQPGLRIDKRWKKMTALEHAESLNTSEQHQKVCELLQDARKRRLRIISYNIDGSHAKLEAIKQVLLGLDADIICLQEVKELNLTTKHTQAHELAKELRMNCQYARAHEGLGRGNAILSKFPMHSVIHQALPIGSQLNDADERIIGYNQGRVALAATVCPVRDDPTKDFLCLCVHFAIYNEGDKSDGEKGLKNVTIIEKMVEKIGMPAILAGDLNSTIQDPEDTILGRLELGGWDIQKGYKKLVTADSHGRPRKIDHICNRDSSGRGWQMKVQWTTRDKASDHYPIIADAEWQD
jgi:endonuclease/exonuclease/phosphatase family metal-dependent hydrolase